MPKVTFLPFNKTVEAKDGDSVLDVALSDDIPIQHLCGGFCACTTCHVVVKHGENQLSEMSDDEDERIELVKGFTSQSRLACQAKVHGDVTVEIVNLSE
jgi:ferredoxin, 2Fe-2S